MSFSGGEKLRAAREQKGLTVDDVAARLKVPARYVVALEQGDLASLPEPTFVRGYVKAYARTVGVDAAELLDSVAPVEVKAPRPLVAVDSVTSAPRKSGARTPKFRGSSHRHHWVLGGVLALGLLAWAVWPGSDAPVEAPVAEAPLAIVAPPATPAPSANGANGMVTLAVPLPGNPAAPVALPPPAAGAPVAASPAAVPAAVPAAPATPVAGSAPVAAAPTVPGLVLRFRGTSWVEVRDVDNVVLHTSVALAGSELKLDGKPPLTVTLGDSSMADVWYNGERVAVDRFARSGVARIIVGQAIR